MVSRGVVSARSCGTDGRELGQMEQECLSPEIGREEVDNHTGIGMGTYLLRRLVGCYGHIPPRGVGRPRRMDWCTQDSGGWIPVSGLPSQLDHWFVDEILRTVALLVEQKAFQNVNWGPRSEIMLLGRPEKLPSPVWAEAGSE